MRLRELPLLTRLGLTFLVLTLYGGLAASGVHLLGHHQNRDERPGLSMEDLVGAYHGVRVSAPMIEALEGGHPEELAASERELLLGWLRGERISEDYDSLDLGDLAPAEVLDRSCLSCHARNATEGDDIGKRLPLEFWDDVARVAFSRAVEPTDAKVLIASAHTHALTMAALSIVVVLLALATRFPARVTGPLIFACGLALLCDLGSWLPARGSAALVTLIAAGGAAWAAATALLLALVLLDLWLPARGAGDR